MSAEGGCDRDYCLCARNEQTFRFEECVTYSPLVPYMFMMRLGLLRNALLILPCFGFLVFARL